MLKNMQFVKLLDPNTLNSAGVPGDVFVSVDRINRFYETASDSKRTAVEVVGSPSGTRTMYSILDLTEFKRALENAGINMIEPSLGGTPRATNEG